MPSNMKTALLIIDTQKFFSKMLPPAIDNIKQLSMRFADGLMPQVFTQHGHTEVELSGKVPNQLVKRWGREGSIAIGSKEDALVPETQKLLDDAQGIHPDLVAMVRKNTYDGFMNTDLADKLNQWHITRLIVCGVMTDCCCDTTGRSAFNRGFETWLVKDACASANAAQHEAGLKAFGYAFGEVLTTSEIMSRIEKRQ